MNLFKLNKENFYYFLFSLPLVVALVFIKSPISYNLGLTFIVYALFYLIFYIFLIFKIKKINFFALYFSLVCLMTSFIAAIHHSNIDFMYSASVITLAVLVFSSADRKLFLKVIDISTLIIFILLIGAWITFIDVFFNNLPQNFYEFPQGRQVYQGKFSLGTNMVSMSGDKYFRPSSIYDEPGAFSLVIVLIVSMRNELKMSETISIIIILLGLITFSLAHLIFLFSYLIYKINFKKMIYYFIIFIFIFILSFDAEIFSPFETLFQRLNFVSPEEGYIRGNSRRGFLVVAFELLQSFNYQDLLFGRPGLSNCCQPLEPLINRGILGSWPYYFILYLFIYYGLKNKNILAFAIVLTLIQRPEIQSAGTAFLVAALLFAYRLKGSMTKNLIY